MSGTGFSACFTGHREIKCGENELRRATEEAVLGLIGEGYTDFYAGGAWGFDMLAEETVIKLREKYPVRLHVILPFRGSSGRWSREAAERQEKILSEADETVVLREEYSKSAFMLRNIYMADASDTVIAYLEEETGGTANTVKYAMKKGKRIIFCRPGGENP